MIIAIHSKSVEDKMGGGWKTENGTSLKSALSM